MKKFLKFFSNLLAAKIEKFQNKNFIIIRVKSQLKAPKKRQSCVEQNWHLKKKLLYFFHVIYIFEKIALKAKLLRLHHDDSFANHFEFKKTCILMQRKFYWFKMIKDIKEYVKDCDMCQRTKTSHHRLYDEFSSLFISTRSWTEISINFIIEFFLNCYDDNIYDVILIIIDRFSKMTHYILVKSTWSVENLIDVLFNKMLLIFLEVRRIVFDRRALFTNGYWSTLCYRIRVVKRLNIVFHSQIDGQIERQNQTLKHYFRCYCNYKQNN